MTSLRARVRMFCISRLSVSKRRYFVREGEVAVFVHECRMLGFEFGIMGAVSLLRDGVCKLRQSWRCGLILGLGA